MRSTAPAIGKKADPPGTKNPGPEGGPARGCTSCLPILYAMFRTRQGGRRISRAMPTDPLLAVVVPCYNEERRLAEGLAALTAWLKGRRPYEILVVDDGSRDATLRLAREHAQRDPAIRVHALPRNRGKGA